MARLAARSSRSKALEIVVVRHQLTVLNRHANNHQGESFIAGTAEALEQVSDQFDGFGRI